MNVKKHFHRFKQIADQSVGRAEKTDVLADVQHLEQRVERMLQALQNTRHKLLACFRTVPTKDETSDKRKKKIPEYHLVQCLAAEHRELDNFPETGLLSQTMNLYARGLECLVEETLTTEFEIDKKVVEQLAKVSEDEKRILDLKAKLKKSVLDMDSSKRRLQTVISEGKDASISQFQDEQNAAELKMESARDNYIAELYLVAGKEVEFGNLLTLLVEMQMEYYRTVADSLDSLLPDMRRKLGTYSRRPVFGCPLEDHLRYSGREISLVIEVCCAALVNYGLNEEGILRLSGNISKMKKIRAGFDAGEIDPCDFERDPHSVAGVLKAYLRDLPDPLMTYSLYDEWLAAERLQEPAKNEALVKILNKLPIINRINLQYLIKFLKKLNESESDNRMSLANIGIVIGPNIIWSPNESGDAFLGSRLTEYLIRSSDTLFPQSHHINFESETLSKQCAQVRSRSSSRNRTSSPSLEDHIFDESSRTEGRNLESIQYQQQKRPKAPAPPPPPHLDLSLPAPPKIDERNSSLVTGHKKAPSLDLDHILPTLKENSGSTLSEINKDPPHRPPPPLVFKRDFKPPSVERPVSYSLSMQTPVLPEEMPATRSSQQQKAPVAAPRRASKEPHPRSTPQTAPEGAKIPFQNIIPENDNGRPTSQESPLCSPKPTLVTKL